MLFVKTVCFYQLRWCASHIIVNVTSLWVVFQLTGYGRILSSHGAVASLGTFLIGNGCI